MDTKTIQSDGLELSDIAARLQSLENKPPKTKNPVTQSGESWIMLSPVELINKSITATDSNWTSSNANAYIPAEAKRAILFAYVDGTSDATGLNKVEARVGEYIWPILAAYEEGTGSAPAPSCQVQVPLLNGNFDYKATIGSGRTSGSFSYVVQLLGYVI